jgi:protease-4
VQQIANGKVWTGEQALALHLVDQIGGFQDALKDTAKSVGIKDEPTVVKPERERRSVLDVLLGNASDLLPNPAKLAQHNVGFYYLWQLKAK